MDRLNLNFYKWLVSPYRSGTISYEHGRGRCAALLRVAAGFLNYRYEVVIRLLLKVISVEN